jgi:uncharacterized protein involved in outer membrane biogenesis
MKWIKRIILSVVALVVIAIIALYFSINAIIRSTVQKQATQSLNVTTTLASAALQPFGGTLQLNDLEIGSPTNFSAPHLFTVDGANAAVHYGQIFGNPVHISKIVITHPTLVVEQSNLKLNIKALMDQMPGTPVTPEGAPSPSNAQPMTLIIDELDVTDATVNFLPGLPGVANTLSVQVPSLSLQNIGNATGAQNGAAIKDVVTQLITALAQKAAATGKVPFDLNTAMSQGMEKLQELGQKAGVPPAIQNQVQQGLDGILNKKKNQ